MEHADGWRQLEVRPSDNGDATRAAVGRWKEVPTVLRIEGYRLFFFSNEGWEPPHVHVEKGAGIAKYWLEPVSMAYSGKMTVSELRRAAKLVERHQGRILERWYEYFGT